MQSKREIATEHKAVYSRMLDAIEESGEMIGNTKYYSLFFSPAVDVGLYDIRDLLRKAIAECNRDLSDRPRTLPWSDTTKDEPCVPYSEGAGWWNIVKGEGGYVPFHGDDRLGWYLTKHEAMARCEEVYREGE
jgi:hypothetical protein